MIAERSADRHCLIEMLQSLTPSPPAIEGGRDEVVRHSGRYGDSAALGGLQDASKHSEVVMVITASIEESPHRAGQAPCALESIVDAQMHHGGEVCPLGLIPLQSGRPREIGACRSGRRS